MFSELSLCICDIIETYFILAMMKKTEFQVQILDCLEILDISITRAKFITELFSVFAKASNLSKTSSHIKMKSPYAT